ncbi:MAG: D-tyrosyl-tRNA(Tyr) deacylase [Deltaproteobacteria bacterium RBG_13_65_10]|nr:MAG: D-tyrosyl-tRNA(Tyr) deacylase [Deltaproteobacteria bacterium RBG_13_65_10]
MRIVIQRVSRASVSVNNERVASIGAGVLLLVGVAQGDGPDEARRLARRCAELRIFTDGEGKLNRSLLDTGGEALVVSQFTLIADTRKGRRPSFAGAARPEQAEPLVETFAQALREIGIRTGTGRFGATMAVELVNDGPVTILIESAAS